MLGKRIINTATGAGAACTTDTVQILDGVPFQSIATYELDGNANDLTGNYNGTASNVTYSTGKFGQAAVFNGSSSKIQLSQTYGAEGETFSYSFWFNTSTNAGSTEDEYIISKRNGENTFNIRIHTDGKIAVNNWTGAGTLNTHEVRSTSSYTDGNWHHFAFTYDGNAATKTICYIDGSRDTSMDWTYNLLTQSVSNGNVIGQIDFGGRAYTGKLDQVRIYDKALSAADVTTLYNETAVTASTNITLEVPSLVAYYKMNDATDETGSYDGTPTNVNFNVAGKFGNAGEFNGSSSYVDLGSTSLGGTNNITISAWIKPSSTQMAYSTIIDSNHEDLGGFVIQQNNTSTNQFVFGLKYSLPGSFHVSSSFSLTANTWNHLAFVIDSSGNYSAYVNGSVAVTGTGFTGLNTTTAKLVKIGRNAQSAARYFNGSIDQVRIFDRAITADEVTKLYNEVYCQPTIVPTNHFEPVIYTGNGSSQSISTLDFAPDFVWMKDRDTTNYEHVIFDSVRGTGTSHILSSDLTSQEGWSTNGSLTSFDSNGFTLPNTVLNNANGHNYVAWNWKAGGADVQNTDGTITSQVSANVDAGFSIVKYTGNGAAQTIGHGLSQAPELIITKGLTNPITDWATYSATLGATKYLVLNGTNAAINTSAAAWNNTNPTDTVFSVGSGFSYPSGIAYAFHSVDGMSKIGSYVGTGASGNSIVTGFRPAFIMFKRTSSNVSGGNWIIKDNKRDTTNPNDANLYANLSIAEENDYSVNFLSNGFEILETNVDINGNGGTYIFMAFAEENVQPQPVLANSFNTVTYTGNGSTQAVTGLGFQPDLVWIKERTSTSGHFLSDSVRGATKVVYSNLTNSEDTETTILTSFDTNGFSVGSSAGVNQNSENYVAWCWKASNDSTINQEGSISSVVSANPAAGFSIVKYTGTGSLATVGHGLSSTPELFIIKNLDDSTRAWLVYDKFNTATNNMTLNTTSATNASSAAYNNTEPTSTVFTVNTSTHVNALNNEHIAYCFHSVDGYQKVGSYTGNATTNVVTTGFQPKFLLVKASSHASSWYVIDSERTDDKFLSPNSSNAEYTDANKINFTSTGFTLTSTSYNNSGYTWIYLAIA